MKNAFDLLSEEGPSFTPQTVGPRPSCHSGSGHAHPFQLFLEATTKRIPPDKFDAVAFLTRQCQTESIFSNFGWPNLLTQFTLSEIFFDEVS